MPSEIPLDVYIDVHIDVHTGVLPASLNKIKRALITEAQNIITGGIYLGNLDWIDVSGLSFNTMLLLEKMQLDYLPKMEIPRKELAVALKANPAVEWYLRHKTAGLNSWLDALLQEYAAPAPSRKKVRQAEAAVLDGINDWLVYVVNPELYDRQDFLNWDSQELREVADFQERRVIDLGAGTGRLTLVAAEQAAEVFAVEPIARLREYLQKKAGNQGYNNIYVVDGLIEAIPFPADFADIVMGGHVFGEDCQQEYREMARVVRPGGKLVLCPGNNDCDNEIHDFLVNRGFNWSSFLEPGDGLKRKYWKRMSTSNSD